MPDGHLKNGVLTLWASKETRLGLFKQQNLMAWIITDADSHCFCVFFSMGRTGGHHGHQGKGSHVVPKFGTLVACNYDASCVFRLRKRHLLVALKLFSLIWEEENDKGHLFFLHMEMFGVYIYIYNYYPNGGWDAKCCKYMRKIYENPWIWG